MALLRSWREFIEVYVQSSPNRPVSYIKSVTSQSVDRGMKRHESFDSRDSNSDDDQPGTPNSFIHSESQASGLSILRTTLEFILNRSAFSILFGWEKLTAISHQGKYQFFYWRQAVLRISYRSDQTTIPWIQDKRNNSRE